MVEQEYTHLQTANMPIAFTYSGSSALSVYIRAQADTGLDYLGTSEARFLKFGTTDPIFILQIKLVYQQVLLSTQIHR